MFPSLESLNLAVTELDDTNYLEKKCLSLPEFIGPISRDVTNSNTNRRFLLYKRFDSYCRDVATAINWILENCSWLGYFDATSLPLCGYPGSYQIAGGSGGWL